MRIFSRVVFQSLQKRASESGIPRGTVRGGHLRTKVRFGFEPPSPRTQQCSQQTSNTLKSWNSSSSIETLPDLLAEGGIRLLVFSRLDSSFSDKTAKARDYQTRPLNLRSRNSRQRRRRLGRPHRWRRSFRHRPQSEARRRW